MHFHCVHWHAPLLYKSKAGAWHQQMPACFIASTSVVLATRGRHLSPERGRGDKGSQAAPAVRNDFYSVVTTILLKINFLLVPLMT